jgi:hypothetical protein
MVLGWDPPKTGLWVLGYEAGIYKTGNCLKSLPDWYWFHQVGIASSPYQTGTGIRYFTQEGEGTSLGANSLSLSLFPG